MPARPSASPPAAVTVNEPLVPGRYQTVEPRATAFVSALKVSFGAPGAVASTFASALAAHYRFLREMGRPLPEQASEAA